MGLRVVQRLLSVRDILGSIPTTSFEGKKIKDVLMYLVYQEHTAPSVGVHGPAPRPWCQLGRGVGGSVPYGVSRRDTDLGLCA